MVKRISYILPPPQPTRIDHLDFPSWPHSSHGQTKPWLVKSNEPKVTENLGTTPGHLRGVAALALDTTTILADATSPQGILYTGGRDGQLIGWDLNLPTTRRQGPRWTNRDRIEWERLDGDADDEDELIQENDYQTDKSSGWALDKSKLPFRPPVDGPNNSASERGPATTPRQSIHCHTDWINDVVVSPNAQHVYSCSSDRTIRAWHPHSATPSSTLLGIQSDHVNVLAQPQYNPSTLISGGLDRKIYIWDVESPRPSSPIVTLAPQDHTPHHSHSSTSTYALAASHSGNLIAAGSPDRLIRLYDPRLPPSSQHTSSLVGHADNLRALVLSHDTRTLLSGSSDGTIKVWSLAAQRCLHTFTHHTDSVWSLWSDHPNLERFFSGDRAGNLAVVDLTGGNQSSSSSDDSHSHSSGIGRTYYDGECLVLARDPSSADHQRGRGIRQIVGIDDEYVWTANGSTQVKRWRDVGRVAERRTRSSIDSADSQDSPVQSLPVDVPAPAEPRPMVNGFIPPRPKHASPPPQASEPKSVAFAATTAPTTDHRHPTPGRHGIPYTHLICLDPPTDRFFPLVTVPSHDQGLAGATPGHRGSYRRSSLAPSIDRVDPTANAANASTTTASGPAHALRQFQARDALISAPACRTSPDELVPLRPTRGLERAVILNDRQHALAVDSSGQVYIACIVTGRWLGRWEYRRIIGGEGNNQNAGGGALGLTTSTATLEPTPDLHNALDTVRERIEGESSTVSWCTVDTRIGSLTVHIDQQRCWDAEVYADEVEFVGRGTVEDQRVNLGKWVLGRLFRGLVKAEADDLAQHDQPDRATIRYQAAATSQQKQPLVGPSIPPRTPARPPVTPAPELSPSGTLMTRTPGSLPRSPATALNATSPGWGLHSPDHRSGEKDYFTIRAGTNGGSMSGRARATSEAVSAGGGAGAASDGMTTPGGTLTAAATTSNATSVSPGQMNLGASLMGKFKFGGIKGSKKGSTSDAAPTSTTTTSATTTTTTAADKKDGMAPEDKQSTAVMSEPDATRLEYLTLLRTKPFHPPPHLLSTLNTPRMTDLPPTMTVYISEETRDAGAWVVLYRSTVAGVESDLHPLEMCAPEWLLEYVFEDVCKEKDPVKLCFVLEPWSAQGQQGQKDEGGELPPMPPHNTRLTANRVLRIRKVIHYIYEKLELGPLAAHRRRTSITPAPSSSSARFGAADQAMAAAAAAAASTTTTSTSQPTNPGDEHPPRAEDDLEVLCNGIVVPVHTTLAATRQFYWQAPGLGGPGASGMDVVLQYRWKKRTGE